MNEELEFTSEAASLDSTTSVADIKDALIDNIASAKEGADELEELSAAITSKSEILENSTQKLTESLTAIHEFVANINAISNKTNILSLNASIEAARSGPAGAGFAVVATSMRGLAADTKAAATEILQLLNDLEEDMAEMKSALTDVSANQTKQSENTNKMIESIKSIEELTSSI